MWGDGKSEKMRDAEAAVKCVRVVLAGTFALAVAFCLLPGVDRGFFALFFGGLIGLELLAYGYAVARLNKAVETERAEAAHHPEPSPPTADEERERERLRRAEEQWRREEQEIREEERQAAQQTEARRRQSQSAQTQQTQRPRKDPGRRRAWEAGQRAAEEAHSREALLDDLERRVVHPWPPDDAA